ncbi:MAG TPA: hypothetical protein PKO06_15990, partial [Candidatus Ozemobacteraceae bacterium]|nr:hypothetical protein [Candidatus Ozemobacteraceae bacterium]
MNVRVASLRPPFLLVISAWIFFVALPCVIIWNVWTRGIAWEEERDSERRRHRLTQELHAFARELELPTFLDSQCPPRLNAIWQRDFTGNRQKLDLSAASLARRHEYLDRTLPFPVAAMIWHGPDTHECTISAGKLWDTPLSKRGLLQLMALANGQARRRRQPGSAPAWLTQLERLTEEQEANLVRGLGSTLFGDVVRARLQPGRSVALLSRFFGGGRLHAFYLPFYQDTTETSPVLGGCLLLIRERDISPERLWRTVARQPLHQGHSRTVVLRRDLPSVASDPVLLPRFHADPQGEHFEGRPAEWFLALTNARGTLRSLNDASSLLLRVSYPSSRLRSPMRAWLPSLEVGIQLA